jgi:hypothetical protein
MQSSSRVAPQLIWRHLPAPLDAPHQETHVPPTPHHLAHVAGLPKGRMLLDMKITIAQ